MPGPNTYDGVINEVLNSTDPTVYDDKRAQTLESLIRTGDQVNPKAGHSYLESIAQILGNPGTPAYSGALLDQLIGREYAGPHAFGAERGGQFLSTRPFPGPPLTQRGASDIPSDPRAEPSAGMYNIPMPDANQFVKKKSGRRT